MVVNMMKKEFAIQGSQCTVLAPIRSFRDVVLTPSFSVHA